MKQGLLPRGCSRFDIVSAHAAFADWWNSGGTTPRDFDPKRRVRCTEDGLWYHMSASAQIYGPLIAYRPHIASYFEADDGAAVDVYLELVRRYFPESYEEECLKIDNPEEDA